MMDSGGPSSTVSSLSVEERTGDPESRSSTPEVAGVGEEAIAGKQCVSPTGRRAGASGHRHYGGAAAPFSHTVPTGGGGQQERFHALYRGIKLKREAAAVDSTAHTHRQY